ncbi:MAG: GNAT family N-acetyltransferase, partial [Spirochaetaceae bacterium]|nr:GNAT family N-acetyltransferase [Spirochaetaceae bacterium]
EKPDHFLISALYIKKDLQHKGFGKMLLDFVENLVNEKKGKVILLKSIQMFDMVTNFYIKCGYKIITTADEISEAKTYLPVEPWEYLFGKVFS